MLQIAHIGEVGYVLKASGIHPRLTMDKAFAENRSICPFRRGSMYSSTRFEKQIRSIQFPRWEKVVSTPDRLDDESLDSSVELFNRWHVSSVQTGGDRH